MGADAYQANSADANFAIGNDYCALIGIDAGVNVGATYEGLSWQ